MTDLSHEKNPNGQCQQLLLSLRKPMSSDMSPAVLPGTQASSVPSASPRMDRKGSGESWGEALAEPFNFTETEPLPQDAQPSSAGKPLPTPSSAWTWAGLHH